MDESQNWTNEFSQSFRTIKDLNHFLDWPQLSQLDEVVETYSLFIPRKLARKIKEQGPEGALARQYIPSKVEIDPSINEFGMMDPIGDQKYLRAPQLIHRYPSRALFTPQTVCPVHCRYCFRKNELSIQEEIFKSDFSKTLKYLAEHSEISEIIFTGGDPLTLSNEKIEKYLKAFNDIKSIKDIRFHTRYPVILPERIDQGFINLMQTFSQRFRTLTIAIHTNHKSEWDQISEEAISKLSDTKVQLLSQTVLLKGINDDRVVLLDLFEHLMNLKIRPYYLHHPDRVKGGMHFYLSLEEGRRVYHELRQRLPGWAIPHYIVDIPGGFGKTNAFNPESFIFSGQLISLSGEMIGIQEH